MDCRTSLVLALGLAAGCAGCVSSPALKCKTEVAFADFKVREAATAHDLTPAQKEGLCEQARVAYHRALTLDPNCREAHAGLARLYGTLGNDDKAVATYRAALQKFPRDAGLWFDLGLCQCRRKDWPAALDALQRAHALEPDNRGYSRALGMTLAVAGRPRDGVAALGEVMGKGEAVYAVARVLHRAGQDELSRQYLVVALKYQPDLAGARELAAQLDGGRPEVQQAAHSAAAPEQTAARPAVAITFIPDEGGARE